MGFKINILRASPLSSSKTLLLLHPKPNPIFSSHLPPTSLFNSNSHSNILPSSPISATPFAPSSLYQAKRPFRGGIVAMAAPGSLHKSEEEWRAILSPQQFQILRQKGTEYPGTGEYDKFFGEGIYNCAGCGTPLYKSTTKFNSGCGWPAFYEGLPGAINQTPDPDGMRIEITCAACGGHLGHVFKDMGLLNFVIIWSCKLFSVFPLFPFKGYDSIKQKNPIWTYPPAISRICRSSIFMLYSDNKQVRLLLPHSVNHRISHRISASEKFFEHKASFASSFSAWKGLYSSKYRSVHWEWLRTSATYNVAGAVEVINDLGLDTLTFLAVTVLIVPTFKLIKASPILGFFVAGVVLNQFGLIRNLTDVKVLSEWGILFLESQYPMTFICCSIIFVLVSVEREIQDGNYCQVFMISFYQLFEMGLELSFARLKALAKYAFGMGLAQVALSTLAFTAFELPPNGAIGTKILEFLFHSRPDLVNIRSIDEAVVIGAALSLSSSAFVLQLLAEKGELPTRFGSATLGILLLQDIAVVPLLVILPILESQLIDVSIHSVIVDPVLSDFCLQNLAEESIWPMLAQESLKALGGLGLLSLGGKFILRRVFEVVADTRSSEAFVALCLLTIAGTSLLTQKLGFSDTLGAFLAGAILAETNFRMQIEADIRPFRGLLLGLFFLTTGTSIDMQLLYREWPNVLTLLAGLIAIKTLIITVLGPRVGLTLQESVRIGFLLSQGGEFGFVVFSLANSLGVLPLELNKLLIIVVVLSMALTPFLNEAGRRAAGFIDDKFDAENKASAKVNFNANEPVVILGFGQMGQVLANFLSNPLASGGDSDTVGWPYVAFDLDPTVVKAARNLGFPTLYGDGSRPAVLQSAGISSPKAIMVMYTEKKRAIEAVQRLRLTFPSIPIYARAQDLKHLLDLKKAGATDAILENAETSLQLGSKLLKGLGMMSDDVAFLSQLIRDSMELQAQEALIQSENRELDMLKPLQITKKLICLRCKVRVSDMTEACVPTATTFREYELSEMNQTDQASATRIQKEIDLEKQDYELNLEGNGLYSKQGTEESLMDGSQDALGRKNPGDPSIPCHTAIDEP
ncbi:K(+) efflux antiporter 3, chloroplastic isoform X1 [Senna tora]|uniref:K(+) efflux antiporter 3, chloroplastic isoform X1 n=1 Tax=Senna tora TaxID=362788 RepID=A0A835CJ11_9FABA|nr:K(+) efflux antiporter 3, chloroplastic isoform X1 [Senna tora]